MAADMTADMTADVAEDLAEVLEEDLKDRELRTSARGRETSPGQGPVLDIPCRACMMPHLWASMGAWLRIRTSELLRHTSVSVLDQALNSATNFVFGLLLVRHLRAEEYGAFLLANTVLYLGLGVENALMTAPMMVRVPKLAGAEKRDLLGQMLVAHLVYLLPVTWLAAAAARASGSLDGRYGEPGALIAVTFLAAFPFMLRELFRQILFVERAPLAVLGVDAAYSVSLLSIAFAALGPVVNGAAAIVWIGCAAGAASIVGGFLSLRYVGRPRSLSIAGVLASWRLSAWGFLGMLVSWVQNQGFLSLLALLRGAEEVAAVGAARLLLTPVALLVTATGSVLRPRCSAWVAARQYATAGRQVAQLSLLTMALSLGYVGMLWWSRGWVVELVLRKPVAAVEGLLLAWAVALLIGVWRENLMLLPQALERFDLLFYLALIGGAAALLGGYLLIPGWAAVGAVAGVALGEAVYLAGILVAIRHLRAFGRGSVA